MTRDVSIICDFDGTITQEDFGGLLAKRFGDEGIIRSHFQSFANHQLQLRDLQAKIWPSVRITEQEFERFFHENKKLRDGFIDFVAHCQDHNVDLQIISGGFSFYLERFYAEYDIDLPIKHNIGKLKDGGVQVEFPYLSNNCDYCSNCKRPSVHDLKKAGKYVVGIGDGTSDYCMAKEANKVFACSGLIDFCEQNKITYQPFTHFNEITKWLQAR